MTIKRFIKVILVPILIGIIAGNLLAQLVINLSASTDKIESSAPALTLAPDTSFTDTEPTIETAPEDDYIFYDIPLDLETQKEIIKICSEYGFSYELILGMISVESDFRPKVIGDDGNTFGLMQIQPRWWYEIMERENVTNLLDPLQNIRCGCAILRELKEKYGTEYRALQAYNTGKPNTNNGYAERVYRRIGELIILEVDV
jgi:hypothetical protein